MKDAILVKKGQMAIKDVAMPTIQAPDDVIIKVVRAAVCGSDLWAYRGIDKVTPNSQNSGHESIGIVEETGSAITTVKKGDFVIAPFTHGCGHCAACRAGYDGHCLNHKNNFSVGNQAEYMRYEHGQWALIKIPGKPSDYSEGMLKSLTALADVMTTGYHAARSARVSKGDTAVVFGDGAVGLCGIIACQLRGAKRIISTSNQPKRAALAKEFGATDNVPERGDAAVKKIMAMTNGIGADAILECVGTEQSIGEALQVGRPGATIGRVGLPHIPKMDITTPFYRGVALAGGASSVTTYDKKFLLKDVLEGKINPGKIFTDTFKLDQIDEAYKAMSEGRAIKSYLVVSQG